MGKRHNITKCSYGVALSPQYNCQKDYRIKISYSFKNYQKK